MGTRLLLLLLALAPLLRAAEDAEERRGIIALYDSQGREDEFDTDDPVHQLLEMPLNYLGMVVRRHDIREGAPPAAWLDHARAVVTYFADTKDAPAWLWPWLEKEVTDRKLRIVHFGEFGPLAYGASGKEDLAHLRAWLARFGLTMRDEFVKGPVGIAVKYRDQKLCAMEADPRVGAVHRGPVSTDPRNRVWVSTYPLASPQDLCTPVVTGPWGGVALAPWTAVGGGKFNERRWYLDPFAFFREALGLQGVPAPHPQMLNGTRMYFLHADGDGFESLSTVQPGVWCGKVFYDEILTRYRLPFTISIIVRSLTDDYTVAEPTPRMRIAQAIFALPNVESGSHAVLHPLRWDIEKNWYPSLKHYTYSPIAEVTQSLRFVTERLAPKGRPCRMMLWSGESNPPEKVLLATRHVGARNINGGVFRWDAWHDSVGFVSPWGHIKGAGIQVYAGAANENDFEGFFKTMPGAFSHIDETIRRTGSPRVLKPADIYCHFYSAERPPRLRALRELIERWSSKEDVAPVFASTYSAAVTSALAGGRIFRTDNGWRFTGFGACRSVRIDDEPRGVDWDKSTGLLGARRLHGALLLHLSAPDARLVLAGSPARRPHVESANCLLEKTARTADCVRATARAFNPRRITLAGFAPGEELAVVLGGTRQTRRADAQGRFVLRLPGPGTTAFSVARAAADPEACAKRREENPKRD